MWHKFKNGELVYNYLILTKFYVRTGNNGQFNICAALHGKSNNINYDSGIICVIYSSSHILGVNLYKSISLSSETKFYGKLDITIVEVI